MNHQIIIFIILFSSLLIIYYFRKIEHYNNSLSLEENLLASLRNNELDNYIKYLNFLNNNGNIHMKLVSKDIYNYFISKSSNLSLQDINSKLI